MLNIPQFLSDNPAWTIESPDEPRTFLDWRRVKLVMKACCSHKKSGNIDRDKLYNTLQRINLLIQSKGSEDNRKWFMDKSKRFCEFVSKPEPEYRKWMTEEEIQIWVDKQSAK